MSYSMQEPEWPPVCECWYDELQDGMDREDCLLHCNIEEDVSLPRECPPPEPEIGLKKPAAIAERQEEHAA